MENKSSFSQDCKFSPKVAYTKRSRSHSPKVTLPEIFSIALKVLCYRLSDTVSSVTLPCVDVMHFTMGPVSCLLPEAQVSSKPPRGPADPLD